MSAINIFISFKREGSFPIDYCVGGGVYLLSHIPLFCIPTDCSLPGSSVHGISQTRMLEWVAIPFSRGSSHPRDRMPVSCYCRRILYHWITREALLCCTQMQTLKLKGWIIWGCLLDSDGKHPVYPSRQRRGSVKGRTSRDKIPRLKSQLCSVLAMGPWVRNTVWSQHTEMCLGRGQRGLFCGL